MSEQVSSEVERVRIVYNHTYVGSEGAVVDKLATGCWIVRLDEGVDVYAWPTQREVLVSLDPFGPDWDHEAINAAGAAIDAMSCGCRHYLEDHEPVGTGAGRCIVDGCLCERFEDGAL